MKKHFLSNLQTLWRAIILLLLTIPFPTESQGQIPVGRGKNASPAEKAAPSSWKSCTTGFCGDAVLDAPHECLWFLKDGSVSKSELKTQEVKIITSGSSDSK